MLAVTVDDVMSWELLCDGYTRYRVKTLFAGRETREQAQADLDRWAIAARPAKSATENPTFAVA